MARSGSLTITMSPPDRADPTPPGPVDSGDGAPGEAPITDGRLLRRQRNRDAVVEALLDLYADGNLRPSTEEIAARSGLSPRSLFRYFDDVEDLTRTAMNRQLERALPLLPIDAEPEAELTVKVGALVDQRFRLFDLVRATAATVSRLRSPFQPVLADQADPATGSTSDPRSRTLFAPELAAMGEPVGFEMLAAADILTSFESYQLLVGHRALEQRAGEVGHAPGPRRPSSVHPVEARRSIDVPPPHGPAATMSGYWPGPWSCEDGGSRATAGPGRRRSGWRWAPGARSRWCRAPAPAATMVVTRDPG